MKNGIPNDDVGVRVCDCGRYWMSLREAIMDGFSCYRGKCSCDYCRDEWYKEVGNERD